MVHKTKLGLSVGLLGGITYLCGLFGGVITLLLPVGYILLKEENMWLRRTALKALILSLSFSCLQVLVGLIPDLLRIISDLALLLNGQLNFSFIINLESLLYSVLQTGKNVLFLLLAFLAFDQRDLRIGPLDGWIEKKLKE